MHVLITVRRASFGNFCFQNVLPSTEQYEISCDEAFSSGYAVIFSSGSQILCICKKMYISENCLQNPLTSEDTFSKN